MSSYFQNTGEIRRPIFKILRKYVVLFSKYWGNTSSDSQNTEKISLFSQNTEKNSLFSQNTLENTSLFSQNTEKTRQTGQSSNRFNKF